MEDPESDTEAEESQPDGIKKHLSKLIKRLRIATTQNSQKDSAKPNLPSSIQQDTQDDIYDFNHTKRGFAILIINSTFDNQPERPFADDDCKRMMELFSLLDFEIRLLENLTSAELWKKLMEINKEVGDDCDCLAIVISSHGAEVPINSNIHCSEANSMQHILFAKNGIIPTDKILELFNDDHCPNLEGKPRMFFIQACRSVWGSKEEDEIDTGVELEFLYERIEDEEIPVKLKKTKRRLFGKAKKEKDKSLADIHGRPEDDVEEVNQSDFKQAPSSDVLLIPCFEDYLVMFSSSSEKIAWSDCGKGGWLIFCLYEVFKRLLDTNYSISLLQILTDVCRKMANEMETRTPSIPAYDRSKSAATIYHMLTKDIFLKPVVHQYCLNSGPVLETSV